MKEIENMYKYIDSFSADEIPLIFTIKYSRFIIPTLPFFESSFFNTYTSLKPTI